MQGILHFLYYIFSIIRKSPGNSGWSQNRHPRVKMNNSIVNAFFSCRKPHRGMQGFHPGYALTGFCHSPYRVLSFSIKMPEPEFIRQWFKLFQNHKKSRCLRACFSLYIFLFLYLMYIFTWRILIRALI